METKLKPTEAVAFGWETMKKNFWFFVVLLIIIFLVQVFPTGIANIFEKRVFLLYIIFSLMAWAIQLIVKLGTIKVTLDIMDKGKAEYGTLFSCAHLLWKFILGSILYFLIVLAGLILLIIPGIIWAIKYQFLAYLIVDKNLDPLEAIKKSGQITTGNKWRLFLLGILLVLINICGAIFFLVGLFATIPLSMMASAYAYRKLLGESETQTQAGVDTSMPTNQIA